MEESIQAVHDLATTLLRQNTFILVDGESVRSALIPACRAVPFVERDGQYWGPPPDDATAIRELERLHGTGASFIVVAWPAFWWLEYYAGFRQHLRANHRCLLENDRVVVFDLRP